MRTNPWIAFARCTLLAIAVLIHVCAVKAQNLTTLYNFSPAPGGGAGVLQGTNSDGAYPQGGLVMISNTLYGVTLYGGISSNGVFFKINRNGTSFSNVHSFGPFSLCCYLSNNDGALPLGGLAASGGRIFGATSDGGTNLNGTLFMFDDSGPGFATVHQFTIVTNTAPYGNADGQRPNAGVVGSGDAVYGTAYLGGAGGKGLVFKLNSDGTGFTVLHSFAVLPDDGAYPEGILAVSDDTVYGTTREGGASGVGTVFRVNTNGTGYAILHDFTTTSGPFDTNSDGGSPGGLIVSGNAIYGTTSQGGTSGIGVIFKMDLNGSNFVVLHHFSANTMTSSDGAGPDGPLTVVGDTLYGVASYAGTTGSGTIFKIGTDGNSYATLHNFESYVGSPGTELEFAL